MAFQAAEVKRVGELKVQMFTIVGGKAASIAFALIALPIPIRHVGEELFGASAYLALHDPSSFWVLAPRLLTLQSAPWLGTIILFSLAVTVNTWFWMWVPNHTLAASRVLLAMSWDRVLPRWLSDLRRSNGAPAKAILVFSGACCVLVLLYSDLGVWRLALHATLVNLIAFGVTCAAAALFPWTHRELYRDSTAAPFEIARVPVIVPAGLSFVAFAGFLVWRYVTTDVLTLGVSVSETLLFLAGLYGAAVVVYLIFRRQRRRREGADVEVYYREVVSPRSWPRARARNVAAARGPRRLRHRHGPQRPASLARVEVVGEVAGDRAPADRVWLWALRGADVHAERAARVEAAALRRSHGAGHVALQHLHGAARLGVGRRRAPQQGDGVGVARIAEHLFCRSLLDDAPEVHDCERVRHGLDDGEIVGDEEVSEAKPALEVVEQHQDARLDGDVERGGRLVEHHELRAPARAPERSRCAGTGRR